LWVCTYIIDLDLVKDDKFVTENHFLNLKHLKNASLEPYISFLLVSNARKIHLPSVLVGWEALK